MRSRQYGRWLKSQATYALSTYSNHIERNKTHQSMHYNSTHPHYDQHYHHHHHHHHHHHRYHQYRYLSTQLLSEHSRQFLTTGMSFYHISLYLSIYSSIHLTDYTSIYIHPSIYVSLPVLSIHLNDYTSSQLIHLSIYHVCIYQSIH